MFEVRRSKQDSVAVIRAATKNELFSYEKHKLANNIEESAQVNKIEAIKINNQRVPIDPLNKEVRINLGNLTFKSKATLEDLSSEKLFFSKCELDDTDL